MDKRNSQFENRLHASWFRIAWLTVLLSCPLILIAYRSNSIPAGVDTGDEPKQSVEQDDPMPPLGVDLIPWQVDEFDARPAGHLEEPPAPVGRPELATRGRVLIVRGILTIFSLGMDDLARKMRRAGYDVKVTTAAQSGNAARSLRDHVLATKSSKPIIIIGHSLGGDLAPVLSRIFAEKGLSVDVLFMLDSTMPSSPPTNVKVCVNMYQNNGTPDWARIFRGTELHSHSPKTRLINIDIRELADNETAARINHFNIDANPWVHKVVMKMIGDLLPDSTAPLPAEESTIIAASPSASRIPTQTQRSTRRNRFIGKQ